MDLKRSLKKYSGFILIAPALIPLSLGLEYLRGTMGAYSVWINHVSPYAIIHQCRISDSGLGLTRQGMDDSQTGAGIPCVCDSLSGCKPVALVERLIAFRFIQAALFIFAGAVILFIFFRKRRALAAKGLLPSLYRETRNNRLQ